MSRPSSKSRVRATSSYKPADISTRRALNLKIFKNKSDKPVKCIDVYLSMTMKELKEKITDVFSINPSVQKFYLEMYNTQNEKWEKIDESKSSASLNKLKLSESCKVNIEFYNENRIQRSSNIDNQELTLQLCKKPMNTRSYEFLKVKTNYTIGKLREVVYKELNKSAKSRSVFLWTEKGWVKYDPDDDHIVLSSIPVEEYSFVSVENDDNDTDKNDVTGLCGIVNLGNTCYMNSVFQSLSNISEFRDHILALDDDISSSILKEYKQLMNKIWSGESYRIRPYDLIDSIKSKIPNYFNYRQQDAQEFMNHFLHALHEEFSSKTTIITHLFYGHIQSEVKCLKCDNRETTNESISFIPLPICDLEKIHILHLKPNGEQRLVLIEVDDHIKIVDDLIQCFIHQHEPKLKKKMIQVYELDGYILGDECLPSEYLSIFEKRLAFLEYPDKAYSQTYIKCQFINHSTNKQFRPSISLICSEDYCDLLDQIDPILAHLSSATGARIDDFHTFWIDVRKRKYILNVKKCGYLSLEGIKCVYIEMDPPWTDIYIEYCVMNRLTDSYTLFDLLNEFFREEILNDYHCLRCKKYTRAQQKSSLCLPLPPVLIIQLKRFAFDGYSNKKIDKYISAPVSTLDLSEYTVKDRSQRPRQYDLIAVINHKGSMNGGHYTTYAKNWLDKKWYLFDDNIVRELDDNENVITKNVYILIYVQVNK